VYTSLSLSGIVIVVVLWNEGGLMMMTVKEIGALLLER
jgi:hypothetical protein